MHFLYTWDAHELMHQNYLAWHFKAQELNSGIMLPLKNTLAITSSHEGCVLTLQNNFISYFCRTPAYIVKKCLIIYTLYPHCNKTTQYPCSVFRLPTERLPLPFCSPLICLGSHVTISFLCISRSIEWCCYWTPKLTYTTKHLETSSPILPPPTTALSYNSLTFCADQFRYPSFILAG